MTRRQQHLCIYRENHGFVIYTRARLEEEIQKANDASPSSGNSYQKCFSSRWSSEYYIVDSHNKGADSVKLLHPVHIQFTEALKSKNRHPDKRSQKYDGHNFDKIAKSANWIYLKKSRKTFNRITLSRTFSSSTISRQSFTAL